MASTAIDTVPPLHMELIRKRAFQVAPYELRDIAEEIEACYALPHFSPSTLAASLMARISKTEKFFTLVHIMTLGLGLSEEGKREFEGFLFQRLTAELEDGIEAFCAQDVTTSAWEFFGSLATRRACDP